MRRREFLQAAGALSLAGCSSLGSPGAARVVVIGAGYGGATAARHVRLWDPDISVTLVDRNAEFISCPVSNLVLGGNRTMADITRSYDGLRRRGVRVVSDEAVAIDAAKKTVTLASGTALSYERLVVSPSVDFLYDELEGFAGQGRILDAWKAGPQTVALRRQLEAMPDGGVYVISIPTAPYRCPPGPYERACQVAYYFKRAKLRSKVLILDANPDVTSKSALFKRAWQELYPGIVEYRPNAKVIGVDAKAMTVRTEFDTVKGDVINVVPPQRAGDIARKAGLITHNNRWCDVDWRTMESKAVKDIHVLGDATLSAPGMPKSGHMANAQGKVCAAALVELLNGREPNPNPVMSNTCYSFVSDKEVIHVASVHQYDAGQNTIIPVRGAGGVSAARSAQEGSYAWSWARNIWADMFS
ncbi:MAG TPA: NAD(P)/FAD-dependent oxidoreductase [Burkholderiales bacterium]|nr:NAD(P)/FAD-dependent oxidoreductase [Burkholderiales bacterium]